MNSLQLCFTLLVCSLLGMSAMAAKFNCTQAGCDEYLKARAALVNDEERLRERFINVLTPKEQQVSDMLSLLRRKEIDTTPHNFPPLLNFRVAKPLIEATQLFTYFKSMPKGGLLHTHALQRAEFVLQNGTYRDDCYINFAKNSSALYGSFIYSITPPSSSTGNWTRVVDLRAASGNATIFDEELLRFLQFYTPEREEENEMWRNFDEILGRLGSLYSYEPVWKASVMDAFYNLVADNVQHVELRGIGSIHDENYNYYNSTEVIAAWLQALSEFNEETNYQYNLTMKWIYAASRKDDTSVAYDQMVEAVNLRNVYPSEVVGFDLVDEEDRYHRLGYYLNDFLDIARYIEETNSTDLPYFFHAGETDWEDRAATNLYDAILLQTKRIGHGYALKGYPYLMDIVKSQQIAIESCPISNQMLKLVLDMRNHPAVVFMNNGVPVTLSSDDALVYGNYYLSYDFFEAYLAWDLSLREVKQLALNSLLYSAYDDDEKVVAIANWNTLWNNWIESVLASL